MTEPADDGSSTDDESPRSPAGDALETSDGGDARETAGTAPPPEGEAGTDAASVPTGGSTVEEGSAPEDSADTPDESTEAPHEDAGATAIAASIDDPDLQDLLGERRRLHGRVRYLWIARRVVPALFLGALAGVGGRYLDVLETTLLAVAVGAAVFALLVLYGVVRSVLLYRSWRYVVRSDSLYLTRGVFTKVQTVVPYVRVQHIDTRRSAFERALGLASLVVYTAGTRGADVTIPGLTPERAERLQTRLKRLAIESDDEDAV